MARAFQRIRITSRTKRNKNAKVKRIARRKKK